MPDWRVSNAALANAALVLSSKNWKKMFEMRAASKDKSKIPWASIFTLSPCRNRCRFSVGFLFAGAPTIEDKLNKKFKTLRWRLLRWRLTLSDQRVRLF